MPNWREYIEYMEVNHAFWEEAVEVHVRSHFYDVEAFKAGRSSLLPVEIAEVGDVKGKTILHLQCHFGMDTLSWAREGAVVTGIDFSSQAIETARALADELGIKAQFLESNVYDLPKVLKGQFDIVLASYGVLNWIPDVVEWSRIAASYVRPGGNFYIIDGHPLFSTIWDSTGPNDMKIRHGYFYSPNPAPTEEEGTYADATAVLENRRTYEFGHPLGDIITSLIEVTSIGV